MAIVELERVSYRYATAADLALRDVTLAIEPGEMVAVVGASGSGKTTLCHTIAGFIPHFHKGAMAGRVQVAGLETRAVPLGEIVRRVGLVFQNPFNQISGTKFTVYEEVAFGLENLGVPRSEMGPRIMAALELAQVAHLAERSPYALSGGQQQRVALASVLVMEPQVLVLDEPTSQLDPVGSRELFAVVREMSRQGTTVVIAEHKLEWIAAYADRVIALADGAVLMDGAPQSVLSSPLMVEHGIGQTRYTQLAAQAALRGLWPEGRMLPVTLEQTVEGFAEAGIHAH